MSPHSITAAVTTLLDPTGTSRRLILREVRKGKQPLLWLPPEPQRARAVLCLYPAQRLSARIARAILSRALSAGCRAPLKPVTISVADEGFGAFLAKLAGEQSPHFGVFFGTPKPVGQRAIFLLFNSADQPVATVKVGFDTTGRELVNREAALIQAATRMPGVPALRALWQGATGDAVALDYYFGNTPTRADDARIQSLLSAWVTSSPSPLGDLPDWQKISASSPAFRSLDNHVVHPVLYHGDFAPWNIKVKPSDGSLTVLDWERGTMTGVPSWDWFHYVVQPAILVRRKSPSAILDIATKMLRSSWFVEYAQQTGIRGIQRELFLAYLSYCRDCLRPTGQESGLSELIALLHRVSPAR